MWQDEFEEDNTANYCTHAICISSFKQVIMEYILGAVVAMIVW
jgi:hypothetical protein